MEGLLSRDTLDVLLGLLSVLQPRDLVLGVATFVALLALFGWWRSATRPERVQRRRQRLASRAEDAAERLLERQGYVVVDRQVVRWWSMWVNGLEKQVSCRADLVVCLRRDRDALFVVEVKTGERAPDPTFPPTRRQLLEYAKAFDVDGVLLLDMEKRILHRVEF